MINHFFRIDERLYKVAQKAEEDCQRVFARIDAIEEYNSAKVLQAFIDNGVSESHFNGSTGYGYNDRGREVLDKVVAQIFRAEDALVRHNFVSGTHTLTVALFGLLRPGDKMVSITGKPYDTLDTVIGIRGDGQGSLKEYGIEYEHVDLNADGRPDYGAIVERVIGAKIAYIQRSRGYTLRAPFDIEEIERLVGLVKKASPSTIVFVDNCYGEFVEAQEPLDVGADLIAGSLIKNPGGGIAKTGGYIAGRKDLVELCSYRLTNPGAGKEVGCTLHENRDMFMGFFHAPTVTASALKTACFASKLFSELGFETYPAYDEYRTDIVTVIKLKTPKALVAFCRGIQKGSPVDAFVTPEPWPMPGYDADVVMAAGAFTLGASIELSADAPLKEPYAVWLQGGLTYTSGKIGILLAAQSMMEEFA